MAIAPERGVAASCPVWNCCSIIFGTHRDKEEQTLVSPCLNFVVRPLGTSDGPRSFQVAPAKIKWQLRQNEALVRPILFGTVAAASLVPTGTRKNKLWCLHVLHSEVRPLGTPDGPRSIVVALATIKWQLRQNEALLRPILFGTVAASSLVPTGTRKNKLWCLHVLHSQVRPLGTSDVPRSFQVATPKIKWQLRHNEALLRPILFGTVAASSLVPTGTRKNKLWCLHVLHFQVRPLGTSDVPRSFQVAPSKIEWQLRQNEALLRPILFGTVAEIGRVSSREREIRLG